MFLEALLLVMASPLELENVNKVLVTTLLRILCIERCRASQLQSGKHVDPSELRWGDGCFGIIMNRRGGTSICVFCQCFTLTEMLRLCLPFSVSR